MAIIPQGAYGTSAGFAAYDKDQQTQATTEHTNVMSRLGNAQAAEVEQKTRDEARMMQIMSGQGAPQPEGLQAPTTTESLLDRVESSSAKLMNAGFFKAGGDLAAKASTMRAHAAQISREQSQEKYQKIDHQEKALTQIIGLVVGIDGPESFAAARDAWKQGHPDDPLPPQFDHYDPAMIDALKHGTTQGLALLRSQREDQRAQDLEEARVARLKETRFRDLIAERRAADAERRTERLLKGGGTKVAAATAPPKAMVDQANMMIVNEFPDIKDTQAGFAIASDAKARMSANRGISAEEALQQAYTAAKNDGDFATTKTSYQVGSFTVPGTSTSRTSYLGGGKTAETALSMPPASGGKPPSASSFRAGRWYMTNRGPAKWTGKNFVGGGGAAPKSAPSGSGGSGSSDEEDLGVE